MEPNLTEQLISERLKEIPLELRSFLVSEELSRKIELVSRKYRLTSDQERLLQNEISFVLLVLDSVDNLSRHIKEELGFSGEKAEELAKDVENYILGKVIKYLVLKESDLLLEGSSPMESSKSLSESSSISLVRKPATQTTFPLVKEQVLPPQPTPEQNPTKASLLSAIENPQRTVIKRYVIEHEPITDPEHIIDDTIDTRPRLES